MKNIVYKSSSLVEYFASNRIKWEQFYESERKLLGALQLNSDQQVLDIGCGCGGLGLVLKEKFGINNYTGVEINALSAKAGQEMNPDANIICGDILKLKVLNDNLYGLVFSLSCVDWNVQFLDMLVAAWEHVKPGGYLIATFRLTDTEGCNDINKSYQYINYNEKKEGELAAYVVLNANNLLQQLKAFNPSEINAYGYWGKPSVTAVTPYEKLCFSAFSIRKRFSDEKNDIQLDLKIPDDIKVSLEDF